MPLRALIDSDYIRFPIAVIGTVELGLNALTGID